MSQDDARLIRKAKEGREDAFQEIYERCQPSVYNYIYYRVGSQALAEEITAEVFMRLVDKVHTLREDGQPILAWLYRVARNLAIDRWRRSCHITWVPLDDHLELEASESSHPVRAAERSLSQAALVTALQCLTEPQRQVIVMKFIEGMSNAEVAEILGRDEGAVKALQHRGLAALRRALERDRCYEL